ncbi:hypothetical protein E3J48_05465 [Candidatus Aerophobetes bacterium]|uniref:Uncharacterized protein n=1 Tax=Aerophobetes bacterium TaxID=2030807 RepID=A0A523W3K1_UNCAE|nr:MAG: hypothetical protein E3J48_05465 [Candidatus Aerophobetes bacterium]
MKMRMKLPEMSSGNWLFWGIITWIGIVFIWIGVLERFAPVWVSVIIGFLAFLAIFRKGPRPTEKEEEEE